MVSSDRTATFLCLVFFSVLGLGALPFLVTGPYFIFQGLPRRALLECDRIEPSQVSCESTLQVLGRTVRKTVVKPVEAVVVEQQTDDLVTLYGLSLMTQDAQVPFGLYTAQSAQAEVLAAGLNSFLQNPAQPTFTVQQRQTQWNGLIVGGGFIGLSLLFLGGIWQVSRSKPAVRSD